MNPASACAQVMIDELIRNGIRHAVLCPGSRSAPLAFALAQAHAEQRLELHVRTDERSAAFLALGLAKGGVPVPIVTTSGTAVANLHPAILEAAHAGVPLLAVTADRPPRLRGTGANQTTSQPGIFAGAPRWSYDLGTPADRNEAAQWRAVICRAWAALVGEPPGPAHLNLPFEEPLVPEPSSPTPSDLGGRAAGQPWVQVTQPQRLGPPIELSDRALVLMGDLPPQWSGIAADWVRRSGLPVLAEPLGATRGLPHGPLLLADQNWLREHQPNQIVVIGRLTLSRMVAHLLRTPKITVDAVSGPGTWPDPSAVVRRLYPWESLRSAVPVGAQSWQLLWAEQAERVRQRAQPVLDGSWPSGLAVAQVVAQTLSDQYGEAARLFLGPSSPVRDVDLAAVTLPTMCANRGLAGIDGCLATASGLALARVGPQFALVGDLTFTHDLGAWMIGPAERRPDLTVVVVNDDGGGIFEQLEPGRPEFAEVFDRVFGTPQGVDLSALTQALGLRYVSVCERQQLADELRRPPAGITVVEVRIPRGQARELNSRLLSAASG